MRLLRLLRLFLPLLLVASVSARNLAAQAANVRSAPTQNLTTPHDSRIQLPTVIPHLLIVLPPQTILLPANIVIALAPTNRTCYTMRTYEFAQQDHSPDRPTFQGQSTCQPASTSHLKSTSQRVVPADPVPR
jgi:hypothetical protein